MIKAVSSMKKLIIVMIFLPFVFVYSPSITYPEEDGWSNDRMNIESGSIGAESYIEFDKWDSERVNIKSGNHKTDGYLKSDSWDSNRSNLYDKNGKQTEVYLKQDRWDSNRINIKAGIKSKGFHSMYRI